MLSKNATATIQMILKRALKKPALALRLELAGDTLRNFDLDKYLTGQADDVDALMTRARILMKLGQHHAAIADFNRAINHAPEPMADYFLERARAQAEGGDNDAALRGLDQGLKRLGPSITLLVYAIELDVAAKHFDNA